ncbi:MAG: branched-chain amino acid transporter ATPase [Frankiales bacterium]|nr:branched-chain amino acid transporter ATPase [Frankiales bacterium]
MNQFIGLIISGLVGGALFAMISVGLVTTYITTGIFNFSQGSVAFACAFAFMELHLAAHIPTIASAAITVLIIAPAMGIGLEAWVFRHLSRAPEQARIVGTVGLALAIPAAVQICLTEVTHIPGAHVIAPAVSNPIALGPTPTRSWNLGHGILFNSNQLIILGFAALTALAYWYILKHTRIGLEMRAAVDGHQLARIRGVKLARVSRYAWIMSFISAGLVGVCGSILLGLGSDSYLVLLFVSAAAAVIGGLRSVPLAFAGGLILGVLENLVSGYVQRGPLAQVAGLGSAAPFVALLGGLWLMSRRRGRVAGTAAAASDAPVALIPPAKSWRNRTGFLVLAVVAVVVYYSVGELWQGVFNQGLAMSVIFLSFVVSTGLGGIVTLGQAAFVTCGGLLAGWFSGSYGFPLWLAAIFAIAAAIVAGVLVALPAIRLSGLQLALATLALAYIFDQLIFEIPAVGNQANGWFLARPRIGSLSFHAESRFGIVLFLALLIVIVLVRNFELSQTGRSVLATRGSRWGAASSGVSIVKARLIVFAVSAAIAAVGGLLLGQTLTEVTAASNPPLSALLWVTIVITIGIRRPAGAVLAGMSSSIFPQLLGYLTTSTQWPALLFGLGAVGLAQNPGGILELHRAQYHWVVRHVAQVWDRHRGGGLVLATAGAPVDFAATPVVDGAQLNGSDAARRTHSADRQRQADNGELPALFVENLRAGYGELEILHGVNLSARGGSITALFGMNGSGKSTLCSVLAGTVDAREGTVFLNGQDASDLGGVDRLRSGLFVVTESRSIFPGLTVEDNLRLTLRTSAEISKVLALFKELQARRDTPAGMLSGGEQQLLAMAPAMVLAPRILVADEPTLGLAPQARERILGLCQALRDRGTAVLLIEERPGEVFDIADDVALIRLGRIEWQRPRSEVSAQTLVNSFLSVTT